MRWILHRGNNNGPNSIENNPTKLLSLIEKGYEIEIDLWCRDNKFYLGHDFPEYEITEDFIERNGLWIHCKDENTLEYMNLNKKHLHYFYHTTEDYVLTSKGYIWCFVGKSALKGSVIVMPEKALESYNWEELISKNCIICSDYLEDYIKPLLKNSMI
jgi:hypothetical protein